MSALLARVIGVAYRVCGQWRSVRAPTLHVGPRIRAGRCRNGGIFGDALGLLAASVLRASSGASAPFGGDVHNVASIAVIKRPGLFACVRNLNKGVPRFLLLCLAFYRPYW